jgi:hypothetical protein
MPKTKTALMKPKAKAEKPSDDERVLLGPFVDFAEEGEDALCKYLIHCGIDAEDVRVAGNAEKAILAHYRKPNGTPDIDAAAQDLMRWPPIAARINELKREKRRQGARCLK